MATAIINNWGGWFGWAADHGYLNLTGMMPGAPSTSAAPSVVENQPPGEIALALPPTREETRQLTQNIYDERRRAASSLTYPLFPAPRTDQAPVLPASDWKLSPRTSERTENYLARRLCGERGDVPHELLQMARECDYVPMNMIDDVLARLMSPGSDRDADLWNESIVDFISTIVRVNSEALTLDHRVILREYPDLLRRPAARPLKSLLEKRPAVPEAGIALSNLQPDHRRLLRMADEAFMHGQIETAVRLYRTLITQLLDTRELALLVAHIEERFARALLQSGDAATAQIAANEAYLGNRRLAGKFHSSTLQSALTLAECALAGDRALLARDISDDIMSVIESGQHFPLLLHLRALRLQGRIAAVLFDDKQAEAALRRAVLLSRSQPRFSDEYNRASYDLGVFLIERGRPAEALQHLENVFESRVQTDDRHSPALLAAATYYASALFMVRPDDSVLQIRDASLESLARIRSADTRLRAQVHFNEALASEYEGNRDKALQEIRTAIHTVSKDPRHVVTWLNLMLYAARLHRLNGNPRSALQTLLQAADVAQNILGRDHPQTLRVLTEYGELSEKIGIES